MKKNKFLLVLVILILATLLLTACGGPNPMKGVADESGKIAGFFKGIWDGWTVLWAFLFMTFGGHYSLYEVFNTGWGYSLGYVIGLGLLYGGFARSTRIVYRKR